MRLNKNNTILLALALCGVLACVLNSESYFDNDVTSITEVNRGLSTPTYANGGPNLIYIQHESLSGSILLNTEEGKTSAPFFHDRMANDPDMYVFEHHRTGSGNTIDAMPSLMTGCLPYTDKGMKYAHAKGRSIGHEFAKNGYSTASFSSRTLDKDMSTGAWSMMYDMLVGSMDKVEEATRNKKLKLDNDQGSSDGQMLSLFEEWLVKLAQQEGQEKNPTGEGAAKKPFYAQFYNFNQHYPYLDLSSKQMKKSQSLGDKYYGSLRATDEFLKSLFDILSRTGQLKNTIIVGSGDHGEEPFKYRYARLYSLNSHILHAAAYVYYPRNLIPNEGVAERLRRNTQQLSYTLDMYPTIRSMLYGVSGAVNGDFNDPNPLSDPGTAASKGCLTGVDLTSVDVPDDRLVLATNLASSKISKNRKALTLHALISKDSALYHRKDIKTFPNLKQGKDNTYVLEFGSCTQRTTSLCMTNVTEDMQEYFRRAVVSLRKDDSVLFGKDVHKSELMKFFVGKVGGEKAITKTKKALEIDHLMAMEADKADDIVSETSVENSADIVEEAPPEDVTDPLLDPSSTIEHSMEDEANAVAMVAASSLETSTAIVNEAPPQDVTEPLPDHSSNGSLLDLIHSVQKTMSWRTHDNRSCGGIFLYMPAMFDSIENQLNNYILVSMMATFMNLSMVILDAPKDTDSEGIGSSSPLGCPKDGKKIMPPVLSSILKPPKWLTSNCPVPCKETHDYSDWKNFRHTVCENGNGRQSTVIVMGGGETHDYFEKHFKDLMLQRPSPVAHDWALRLGAKPEEADVFSQLNGDQIWDYLGALVARSNLLQFQPWILKDVASYMKQSGLPNAASIKKGKGRKEWTADAIQVQRGDELLSSPQAVQFMSSYWDAHGGYDSKRHNYIPIDHYLREYLSQYKCSRKIRKVYIATSDTKNTKKELSTVGSKAGKGKVKIGCITFQFKFPPAPSKKNSKLSGCAARYSRTVNSIAHFIIFSSAKTFIGDVNSDLGILVRTFRLKLNKKKSGGHKKPVSLSRTKSAFGKMSSFFK